MADFLKTVSNSLNLFGETPASQWGVMVWGVDNWGEGKSGKDIWSLDKYVVLGAQSLSDSLGLSFIKVLAATGSFSLSFKITSLILIDGNGYNYVFSSDQTDAVNRSIPSYIAVTPTTTSWTAQSASQTVWS